MSVLRIALAAAFLIVTSFLSSVPAAAQDTPDSVTVDDIRHAERLLGLTFSETERDSMRDALAEQLGNYLKIRSVTLDYGVPPAIDFNPVPRGMKLPEGRRRFVPASRIELSEGEAPEQLAFASVGELAALIRQRKVTSVQLTKMYLNRLKKFGPVLECVVTLTEDLAMKQAARADSELATGKYRGPLHGIPYGAKDLLATRGVRTTWGSAPYKEQMLNEDATVIKKLEEAGAVLVAKLTMGELAWGDVWFGGKTRNPWKISQGSSGSSAGSASATAAGLVAFAIGTETWGSITSPSTVCGTSGLRPTYGRVSRVGAMALSWSMDKIGPLCRTVDDCALVFNEIYGPDGIDQTLYEVPFSYDASLPVMGLKIGYLKADFDTAKGNKVNDLATIEWLRLQGADLVPITLPPLPINDLSIILSAEAAAAFDELTRTGRDDQMVRQIKNAWPNVFRASRFIPAVEYLQANRIRYQLVQKMAEILKDVDLYVAPSMEGDNSLLTNLTGHPIVVVQNGWTPEGTPTSITFTGRLFDEGTILAVAHHYQQATGFHQKHPVLTGAASK